MNKKFIAGLALGMTMLAGSCFAEVIEKTIDYKDNAIKCPQVVGIAPKAANNINKYIEKVALGDAKSFIDKHGKEGGKAWLYTEVIRDDEQYLTLRIASASYFKGAAHPNTYVFGMVFDKNTGKRLPLNYFVEMPPADHMEGYVRGGMFKMLGYSDEELELSQDYHLKTISEEFLLDKNDNLDLIYQQYDLGPYAMGSPRIRLDKAYVDRNGHVLPKG